MDRMDGIGGHRLFHDRRNEGRRHAPYHPPPLTQGHYEQAGHVGVFAKTFLPGEPFDPNDIQGHPVQAWVPEKGQIRHSPGWS